LIAVGVVCAALLIVVFVARPASDPGATAGAIQSVGGVQDGCAAAPVHYRGLPLGARAVGVPASLPWVETTSGQITGSLFYYGMPVFSHRVARAVIGARGEGGGGVGSTKILWWVHGRGAPRMTVSGERLDRAGTYRQFVVGPNPLGNNTFFPSIITVPSTGCWTLHVRAGSATGAVTFRVVTAGA
jgi:hypothetical protein